MRSKALSRSSFRRGHQRMLPQESRSEPIPLDLKDISACGVFEGYASVFDVVDLHQDIIARGAFKRALLLFKNDKIAPKMLWQHNHEKIIGKWISLKEDAHGLRVKGQLFVDHDLGKEAYRLLKKRALDGLSIGFRPLISSPVKTGRKISDVDLVEISLVTFPSNKKARVMEIKSTQKSQKINITNNKEYTFMETHQKKQEEVIDTCMNQNSQNIGPKNGPLEKGDVPFYPCRPQKSLSQGDFARDGEMKAFHGYLRRGASAIETKALSTEEDNSGRFLIPEELRIKIEKEIMKGCSVRSLSSVMQISGSSVDILLSKNAAEVGWVSEVGDRAETAPPQLSRVSIGTHELYAKPRTSQKLLDDAALDVQNWLIGRIAYQMSRMENAAFLRGDGVGKPKGILSYPLAARGAAGHGQIEEVRTGTAGTITANGLESLLDVVESLKPEYHKDAVWVLSPSAFTKIRKLKDENGQFIWSPSLQESKPSSLLGYPVHVMEDMPPLRDGEDAVGAIFGSFRAAYQVVDRKEMSLLRDPYSAKPYVEFYAVKRVGGDVVNFEALKILNFASPEGADLEA